MIDYPCKDCRERYPGCHDKCDIYQEAHSKQLAANRARYLMCEHECVVVQRHINMGNRNKKPRRR